MQAARDRLDAALTRVEGRAIADAADGLAVLGELGRLLHATWLEAAEDDREAVLAAGLRRVLIVLDRVRLYLPEHQLELSLGERSGFVVTVRP